MMTRILLATNLSLAALAPMAQAGANGNPATHNGVALNGLTLNSLGDTGTPALPGQPLNRRSIGGGDPATHNGVDLNAIAENALTQKGLGNNGLGNNALASNGLGDNAITGNAIAGAVHRAHLKGFTVNAITLPDGTVVGW